MTDLFSHSLSRSFTLSSVPPVRHTCRINRIGRNVLPFRRMHKQHRQITALVFLCCQSTNLSFISSHWQRLTQIIIVFVEMRGSISATVHVPYTSSPHIQDFTSRHTCAARRATQDLDDLSSSSFFWKWILWAGPVCPSVSAGRFVCHNFQKGREVSPPYSYRNTFSNCMTQH